MRRLAAIARRHRLGHAVLFAVTVCLLVATAAVDPLLTRSFGHAVVNFHAQAQDVAGRQVVISANSAGATSPGDRAERVSVPRLEGLLDPRVRRVVGDPVVSVYGVTQWQQAQVPATVRATVGQCSHVKVVQGRCPTATREVLISSETQRKALKGLRIGSAVTLGPVGKKAVKLRVVGVFTASTLDPFWGGTDVAGYDGASSNSAATLLATTATVKATVPLTTSVSYPLNTAELTPDSLTAAAAGAREMENSGQANISEILNKVYRSTAQDVFQVGRILPFLLVQLGVVLLILLVQATSFFATMRRGEAAVLKMRGNGTAGVVRLGAAEFLPPYIVGSVAGFGLAHVVDALVRHLWLPGDVAAHWSLLSAGTALAMAVLAAAVWCFVWWLVARESISSLLRARPSRRRGARLSLPAAVAGAVCLIGVVLTATKSLTGGPVQVTPVLLAGFVSLVVGALLAPVAARSVRWLLRRRRAADALAVAHLGRRAGVVTAVTTLIITSALLTLSVSVFARGADNRAARTAAELGAPALVDVTVGAKGATPKMLLSAVDSVDPQHHDFTPAVRIKAVTPESNATLGVVPADMERIGLRTGLRQRVPWSSLGSGGWVSVPNALVASWTMKTVAGSSVSAPTMNDADGPFRVAGVAPYIPGAGARTIVVDLQTMLRAGNRKDDVAFEVFSATQDPKRLAALRTALERAGFAGDKVQAAAAVRAGYDASATAWAMNLSIVVSVLSLLAALTTLALVAVASRDDRRRDLRALRAGGVARSVVRAATVREFVLLALAGSVIGAVTAPVGAWLTGPTMLWWSTVPEQPVTRTGFQWQAGSLAAIGLVVLLVLVGAAFGLRLARASDTNDRRRTT